MCKTSTPLELALQLHGHFCPQLLIGVRLAELAQVQLRIKSDSPMPSQLYTIVNDNSCSIDAIQAVLGCTAGKGNLVLTNNGSRETIIINPDNQLMLVVKSVFAPNLEANINEYISLSALGIMSPAEEIRHEQLVNLLFEQIMSSSIEDLFIWSLETYACGHEKLDDLHEYLSSFSNSRCPVLSSRTEVFQNV